jgi:hypothetical protein
MPSRKIAKSKAEKRGVWADRVSVTLMLPGRTAWGMGVLSRIRGVSLGKLCEDALAELLRGQGIPWSKYDEARASMVSGSAPTEGEASSDGVTLPIGEGETPSLPYEAPPPRQGRADARARRKTG